jgi:hypothetical protein
MRPILVGPTGQAETVPAQNLPHRVNNELYGTRKQ